MLKYREDYDRLIRVVPKGVLEPYTDYLINQYGRYYRENPDAKAIDMGSFLAYFNLVNPKMSPEDAQVYRTLIERAKEDVAEEVKPGIVNRLIGANYADKYAKLLERFAEGEEVDLQVEVRTLADAYEAETAKKVKVPWVDTPIEDLLKEDENDVGLRFRIPELHRSMRALRPGDFGLIAARPDKGKTTFMTDQLTYMAKQIDVLFPGEMRTVLWFNNEGPGKRIKKRCYQSALNASADDLVAKHRAGTLRDEYTAATGRGDDILRIVDIHDFWHHEVEDIIKKYPPGLIVFDMIDNIKFGGGASNNGQRTDQLLEAMYQWARVIGVKHDCIVLAATQTSADAENMMYPTLSMLKDSKTGKQGAADFILTIGAIEGNDDDRFLGMTKNKLHKEGGPKSPQLQVFFDGVKGRYLSAAMTRTESNVST